MPEEYAKLSEVAVAQFRQDFRIHRVVAKCGLVLTEPEASKPRPNVHGPTPSPRKDDRRDCQGCPARFAFAVHPLTIVGSQFLVCRRGEAARRPAQVHYPSGGAPAGADPSRFRLKKCERLLLRGRWRLPLCVCPCPACLCVDEPTRRRVRKGPQKSLDHRFLEDASRDPDVVLFNLDQELVVNPANEAAFPHDTSVNQPLLD